MIPLHPNCRCIALPTEAEEHPYPDDPVAKDMYNPEDGKEYLNYKKEYKEYFDGFSDDEIEEFVSSHGEKGMMRNVLKEKYRNEMPNVWEGIHAWKGGTQMQPAARIKYTASQIDRRVGQFTFPQGTSESYIFQVTQGIPKKEYLRVRAFNKAYMERRGINKVDVYRGTCGEYGKSLRTSIQENPGIKKWNINDGSMAGYSDNYTMANDWGAGADELMGKGITVARKVDAEDVILHADMFGDVIGAWHEREFIIAGGKRMLSLENIFLE